MEIADEGQTTAGTDRGRGSVLGWVVPLLAAYVKEQGLGGVMIWSLDYDDKGDRSLLSAIHQTLRLKR